MKKLFIAIVAAAISAFSLSAQSIKVQAPRVVAVGEQFNIVFTIEGESRISNFSWECGPDLMVVWGPQTGSSTSISIINGNRTTSITKSFTYIVEARAAGVINLPTATVDVKGEQWTSGNVSIEVVSGERNNTGSSPDVTGENQKSSNNQQTARQRVNPGQAQSAGDIGSDDLYMKMFLSRSSVVVGEPITVTLKLYNAGYNLTNLEDVKLPGFNGFWSQDITPDGNIQFERENVDGYIMNSAVIKQYVIIPQKAGEIEIDPAEMVCRIDVRRYSNTGSIFDGFFDDYATIRKRVATPRRVVKVNPLPAGAPQSFYGGVGKFAVGAKLSESSIAAHEAGSLILTVSGKGNISLLETPKVSFPPDFEVYDVKAQERIDKASGATSGTKIYEFPFIPRSHGDFTIEPISYTYYDTDSHSYVTLKTQPLEIHVERGTETGAGSTVVSTGIVSKKGVKTLNEDIRYICTKDDALTAEPEFFVFSGLFWILIACIVLLWGLAWAGIVWIRRRRSDVVGAKVRKASKMALSRLRTAAIFLDKDLYSAFYEELHKALLGFVADKFNLKVAELSQDSIQERLSSSGVPSAVIDDLKQLLSACDEARYCPSSGHSAMKSHYDKALATISAIDASMKHSSSRNSGIAAVAAFLTIAASLSGTDAYAATDYVDSLWTRACTQYTEGNWEESLEGFEQLYNTGFMSAKMEYNLGNAYFKTMQYGKAVLHFERALKIDPSYEDARYNLAIAREFTLDDIESVPEFFLKKWLKDFSYSTSSNGWALWFFIFLAAAAAMSLLFILGRNSAVRKTGFFSAIVLMALAAGSLAFASSQKSDYHNADSAVVLRPVSSVKSSPSSDSASDLFVLHEGTKVQVLDNVGAWTNIRIQDGRKGWILSRDIEVI
ncbi:MAG: BatD family protein [Bacteroidales bacterium]|nr:BatD family protein [Bacteroidales bacterium]